MDIDCLEASFKSLANETRGVLLSPHDIKKCQLLPVPKCHLRVTIIPFP